MKNSQTTLFDIARQTGVSKTTVSMVINGSTRISSETSDKVWTAVRNLHYQPNEEARKLAQRRWTTSTDGPPNSGKTTGTAERKNFQEGQSFLRPE